MKDLSKIRLFEAIDLIKKQKLKSEELVRYHLELANTKGKDLNAFITVLDDSIEKAREVDQKIQEGKKVGLLAGIPCTVKDILMTKGIRTTAASKILKDFIAPYSATVVEKLEEEGAVIIGKTNCDPFAYGASGENSGFGPTLNPIDNTRVPGGSSSGAAASLAAGIGLFAIGTDTGGSVRQPASLCGLVGLKVTYGRNSRYGLIAMASSFDTPGILSHTVREAAFIEEIIAGKDSKDATTYDLPVENYFKKLNEIKNLDKVKVGVPKQYFEQGITQDVKQAVQKTITKMKKNGAEIIDVSLPILKQGISVYYILVPSEISSNMARYDGIRFGRKEEDNYMQNLLKTRSKYLEPEVKRRIMLGTYALSAGYADEYYKHASRVRVKITREIMELFKEVDILVGPTSPFVAFKLGEKSNDPLAMYLADVYTVNANIAGCPAISINCGYNKEGLPIGFQIMSEKFSEAKLLGIAANTEKIINES
ncbi:Asp-tRNA(Asn)/Glu-tRNA(Gln) amidotransferase subunit GatA [Candidatus Dojkabacteria bacterium]|nr:Asp-tRNA(Asn)/Glu-tRNA(Gln) amidotransferase subunit GatA [Candidatus Dojkabacteria bacterium]